MELTVYFNGQFWVAVAEVAEDGVLRAARHIFGASEPGDPEVYAFVQHQLMPLLGSVQTGVSVEDADHRRVNPKRLQRLASRALATTGISSKAQTAMAAELAERKRVRHEMSRTERAALQERKRLLAREKAKAKHRGH